MSIFAALMHYNLHTKQRIKEDHENSPVEPSQLGFTYLVKNKLKQSEIEESVMNRGSRVRGSSSNSGVGRSRMAAKYKKLPVLDIINSDNPKRPIFKLKLHNLDSN